jgi:hypothetical protein
MELWVFTTYTQGSAYWAAKLSGDVKVDDKGVQGDY